MSCYEIFESMGDQRRSERSMQRAQNSGSRYGDAGGDSIVPRLQRRSENLDRTPQLLSRQEFTASAFTSHAELQRLRHRNDELLMENSTLRSENKKLGSEDGMFAKVNETLVKDYRALQGKLDKFIEDQTAVNESHDIGVVERRLDSFIQEQSTVNQDMLEEIQKKPCDSEVCNAKIQDVRESFDALIEAVGFDMATFNDIQYELQQACRNIGAKPVKRIVPSSEGPENTTCEQTAKLVKKNQKPKKKRRKRKSEESDDE